MPINAREAVLKALSKVRRSGAWTDAALNSVLIKENLEERDAALTSRIFYGVIQNQTLCDFYISSFSSVKMSKMEPQVLDILRLSVYQIVFMSKIPVNAAVHEGVELAKKHSNPRVSGLVNAILRKISSNLDHLPAVTGETAAQRLSIQYSHPLWLTEAMLNRLGEEGTAALLDANNREAAITVNINTQKADVQAAISALQADQATVVRHPWLANCLELTNAHQLECLTAFENGLFYVQDAAAILTVLAAAPKPKMFVIDGCAAPGGKSFATAILMQDIGHVLSFDVNEKKLQRITEGAKRLGLKSIETRIADALEPISDLFGSADIVLADVPCSGYGVIRKKPEIRYKSERDVINLPELQLQITSSLSRYVKPGGVLLYSTCTLLQRENEGVIDAFLQAHADFTPEAFLLPGPIGEVKSGMTTLWPHIHGTDGFFICRLKRSL
jgi:16S rRNA (cytosine967-C5)-methyltransferase